MTFVEEDASILPLMPRPVRFRRRDTKDLQAFRPFTKYTCGESYQGQGRCCPLGGFCWANRAGEHDASSNILAQEHNSLCTHTHAHTHVRAHKRTKDFRTCLSGFCACLYQLIQQMLAGRPAQNCASHSRAAQHSISTRAGQVATRTVKPMPN